MGSLPPNASTLFDRARSSSEEYRKVLTEMSAGGLAVFFLALTAAVEPPLSSFQRVALILALVAMSLAILSGIISWLADARWAYSGAQEVKLTESPPLEQSAANKDDAKGIEYWKRNREFWHSVKRKTEITIAIFFLLGVLAASSYVGSRVVSARHTPRPNVPVALVA